jgi:8-oxo-dGTP pyrophosphatase MutT (NUDIX family)
VVREISEEAGWRVSPGLATGLLAVPHWPRLRCRHRDLWLPCGQCAAAVVSAEHRRVGLFTKGEVADLRMPDGYKRSIVDWFARLAG